MMNIYEMKEHVQLLWEKASNWWSNLRRVMAADKKGWLICLAVLVITVVRSSITYSFGVFVVKLEDLWKRPLAEQNWIGTLSFCISLSCAPVSVAFIRMLRHRGYRWSGLIGTVVLAASCLGSSFVNSLEWMFFTHSLLYGVGSSLIYMASSLVIGEYFDKDHKYHVLATSILLCGYPIGSLLFNPINAWLVTRFGWRVAFRCASGLILMTGLVCCWSFSSKDSPNMERLDEESEEVVDEAVEEPEDMMASGKIPRRCCTMAEIKHRPEIVLWYIGNGLSYLGFFMPFLNLAYYMKTHNIPTTRSSWVLTLLSLAECVTYIIASFLGDYLKGRLVYVNVVSAFALSIICIIWPFVDVSYSLICLIAIAMGGFLGLNIVYTYAASGEVTQLPIDIAWSFTNLWSGMGILVGPFFSGAIFDLRKSYDDVFYVVGALYLLNSVIFGGIPFLEWRRKRKENAEPYSEIHGMVSTNYRETYKISSMRSVSKGSLANGEAEGVISSGGDGVGEYGTINTTNQPTSTTPSEEKSHRPAANGQAGWTAQWGSSGGQGGGSQTWNPGAVTQEQPQPQQPRPMQPRHQQPQQQQQQDWAARDSHNSQPSWPPQNWQ